MVELELFCALVGAQEDVLSVNLDENASVAKLKDEIKKQKENGLKGVDANNLQLFLAKTKDGKRWLPDEDPAALELYQGITSDSIKSLTSEKSISPTRTLKHWLFETSKMPQPSTGQIHVLVVYPKGVNVEHDRLTVPKGPAVNISSCEDLLVFLEGEMTNKENIMPNPHILDPDSLQFRLVGRQEAIETAASCFRKIIKASRTTGSDRTHRPIPVCSGISGLGKTRMLEEGGMILKELGLDPEHIAHVIVSYGAGFSPNPVEQSMSIEASFSWRLLYRFFLDNNCAFSFADWFQFRLPCNGHELTLSTAIGVIKLKLRQRVHGQEGLYLFLGIDEYQRIEEVGASRRNPNTSILRELVDAIKDLLCVQSVGLVVLPMFAGTDLGIIAMDSIANTSCYMTERLPMTLLTLGEVIMCVESNAEFAMFLRNTQIRRHLFSFGGVPRWVVEYLLELKKYSQPDGENASKCFEKIRQNYVASYANSIETRRLIRLAAFAVSNQQVAEGAPFDADLKWSQLRDSALCLLNPCRTSAKCDVQVPYGLLQFIADTKVPFETTAEISFAKALQDMKKLVDAKLFDLEPWQSWEKFGACFYAVRINALLVLGRSTVTLKELFPGALMDEDTCEISVKLAPSRVFQCAEQFGTSTPKAVSHKDRRSYLNDWTSSGSIIVNGVGRTGVDIFFALKDALSGNLIVFVDQRKRELGKFQPSSAKQYLRRLRKYRPAFLGKDTRLVGGIMNCVAPSNLQTDVVPHDCFLLTRDETERFYGALAYHPACSPFVLINSANKTALMSVLIGSKAHKEKTAEEIMRKRMEPSGGFTDYDAMRSRFKSMKLEVEIDTENALLSG